MSGNYTHNRRLRQKLRGQMKVKHWQRCTNENLAVVPFSKGYIFAREASFSVDI
jgi:hypothetical protein